MMTYRIHRNNNRIIFPIGFLNVFQSFSITYITIVIHIKARINGLVSARRPCVFFCRTTANKNYQKNQKYAMFRKIFQTEWVYKFRNVILKDTLSSLIFKTLKWAFYCLLTYKNTNFYWKKVEVLIIGTIKFPNQNLNLLMQRLKFLDLLLIRS